MADRFYAKEKMMEAVLVLATHPDRIKERLYHAFLRFQTIGMDMPEDFASDYEWIVNQLTSVPGKCDEGAVVATLCNMTDKHAVEIARRIVDLEYRLENE